MKKIILDNDKSKWSLKTQKLWELECKLRKELLLVLEERVKSQIKDTKKV